MFQLIYEKTTGLVVSSVKADVAPEVMAHHAVIVSETKPDFSTVKVVDGVLIEYVSPAYLASLKAKKVKAINEARDARLDAGVATQFGDIQADVTSRINIAGAVNMALLDQSSFAISWRMADNALVELDAGQMVEVGKLVGEFVSQTYARSFELKDTLANLETLADLNAFRISFAA